MLKLDNNLLDELGLGGLPEDQKRSMLQHIYDTLELRVGTNLANQMSDKQLEEFEKFIDDGGDANQAQALQWLEANLPNYKQVVNDVFEALKSEIRQMAPQIMVSTMQQPQPVVQQAQPAAPVSQAPTNPVPVQQPQYQPVSVPQTQQQPAIQVVPQQQPIYTANPYQQQQPVAPSLQPDVYLAPVAPTVPDNNGQVYQFPVQQPPAGPGNYQAPPYYPPPSDQQAA